jgi:hypothetical protein
MKSTTFTLNTTQINSFWQPTLESSEALKGSYFNLNNALLNEVLKIQQLGLVIWSPDSNEYGLLLGELQKVCGWSNELLKKMGPENFLPFGFVKLHRFVFAHEAYEYLSYEYSRKSTS